MTNAASKPTPEAPQEPKKPPNPILNNFLSAAVFGAFDAALLTYLKTAQNLPENLRNPIYVMSVIVMMIVLGQFAFNTALFMHAKHRDELDRVPPCARVEGSTAQEKRNQRGDRYYQIGTRQRNIRRKARPTRNLCKCFFCCCNHRNQDASTNRDRKSRSVGISND